ncbi:hypothetical protein QCA50_014094 [Cerrena zonata]|uniref:Uncharacterized protein n=1 Tax=Cerrena zonata TaxID=2478898 RepID=A0AAW0FZD8_9APHY
MALYRYFRVISAAKMFRKTDGSEQTILRWRVGMHNELRSMNECLGHLIMGGCTGGTFLQEYIPGLRKWVSNVDHHGYFLVDLENMPLQELEEVKWESHKHWALSMIPRSAQEENQWWLWDEDAPIKLVSRPIWWEVRTVADTEVYGEHHSSPGYCKGTDLGHLPS